MFIRLRVMVVAVVLVVGPVIVDAAPVDVDGDGIVGPLELIDLSLNWKGPALLQPWQVDGANIFYSAGNVGIGTANPVAKLDVRGGAMLVENLGDQADLLWLSSERSWVFRQEGSGAGAALKLQSVGGGGNKRFIIQTDGEVGIGTSEPTAKLDVRGDIRLGSSGQFRAAAGEENLRIVRGSVRGSDGSVVAGAGFTVSRSDVGHYTVTYNTPFSARPAVTVTTTFSLPAGEETISDLSGLGETTSFTVSTFLRGNGSSTDCLFHFIAIGLR